ncbi:hypothetical protein FGD71_000775 [Streptomyces sporangiiformans]|uniref:Uncharacterized protein n=1 Tax=Streptomyces sporangiiformans TaxID=2315329 RepID=A0A505DRU3_9ACTN|nr:hypothetical protein FGD71_000775 [Streptomyces sporangiiformans]
MTDFREVTCRPLQTRPLWFFVGLGAAGAVLAPQGRTDEPPANFADSRPLELRRLPRTTRAPSLDPTSPHRTAAEPRKHRSDSVMPPQAPPSEPRGGGRRANGDHIPSSCPSRHASRLWMIARFSATLPTGAA